MDQPQTQGDVREEVEREATAERHGGHRGQRLADEPDRRLEAESEQDKPVPLREV